MIKLARRWWINQKDRLLINHESESAKGIGVLPCGKARGASMKQMFAWCSGNLSNWWPHWLVTSKQWELENSNFATENYLLKEPESTTETVLFSGQFRRHSNSYFSIERLWNLESDLALNFSSVLLGKLRSFLALPFSHLCSRGLPKLLWKFNEKEYRKILAWRLVPRLS